jgi:hypothetical protein
MRTVRDLRLLLGLVLGAASVLGGCQMLPGEQFVPGGIGTISIDAPQTVPAGGARIFYQDGGPVATVDRFEPHCELEISTVSEQTQTVAPGRFRVVRGATAVLSDPEARLPLFGPFVDVGCGDEVYYEVEYRLVSEAQPGVRLLRCRQAFPICGPGRHHYPTRDMVEATLGKDFFIE